MPLPLFLIGLSLVLLSSGAMAATVVDLSQPESVVVDPKTGMMFISNINGSPYEKDSNGYISKVSADGLVVVLKFIESREGEFLIHAPKGMVLVGRVLWVIDIDAIKGFDADKAALVQIIDLGPYQPKFLKDIASDQGRNLYVSDMGANRIFKILLDKGGTINVFKEGEELGHPNGLLVNGWNRNLLVATGGTGKLLEIDRSGHIKVLRHDLVGLGGLAASPDGTLYLSSFKKGEIYRIARWGRGGFSLFQSGLRSPADLFFDRMRNELWVPLMDENQVSSFKITRRSASKARSRV